MPGYGYGKAMPKSKPKAKVKVRKKAKLHQRRSSNVDYLYLIMTSRKLTDIPDTLLEKALGPGVTLVDMADLEDGDHICLDGDGWMVTKNGNWYRHREDNIIELDWA